MHKDFLIIKDSFLTILSYLCVIIIKYITEFQYDSKYIVSEIKFKNLTKMTRILYYFLPLFFHSSTKERIAIEEKSILMHNDKSRQHIKWKRLKCCYHRKAICQAS